MSPHTAEPETRMLLVEDSYEQVFLAKVVLKKLSNPPQVTVAEDGQKAMDFMHQRGEFSGAARPDLVLLDLNLPILDGREVLRELRSDPRFNRVPIVILSTSSAPEDIQKCRELGADDYYVKPLGLEKFTALMTEIQERWLKRPAPAAPRDRL